MNFRVARDFCQKVNQKVESRDELNLAMLKENWDVYYQNSKVNLREVLIEDLNFGFELVDQI